MWDMDSYFLQKQENELNWDVSESYYRKGYKRHHISNLFFQQWLPFARVFSSHVLLYKKITPREADRLCSIDNGLIVFYYRLHPWTSILHIFKLIAYKFLSEMCKIQKLIQFIDKEVSSHMMSDVPFLCYTSHPNVSLRSI